MANILQVYEQCINNPEILKHGDQFLSEYLKNTPNFILESLQLILDANQPLRKYIAILFKNVLLLNWNQLTQEIKSDVTNVLIDGIYREQTSQIQEILTLMISEIMRRDEEFQNLIPAILQQYPKVPHFINTIIHIYQNLDGQRLISFSETILQHLLAQQTISPKIYQLVYFVIRMFSHCEQTDIDQLKACFDSTFIQWMERFSFVLQQQNQLESQIYVMKTLNLIFKDLKTYSKQIRKAILPQVQVFLNQLANSLTHLEGNEQTILEINFLDETYDQEPSLEVLLFYTLQMLMEMSSQQLCNTTVYNSLLQILSFPIKNLNIDHFIVDEDPTVVQVILLFFEQQLSNKKTHTAAKQLLTAYLSQQGDLMGQYVILQQFGSDLLEPNQYLSVIENMLQVQSNNQIIQLQKLIAATNIYILSNGSLDHLISLLKLHIDSLKQQLGLVNLFNIGKLCSHAQKHSTINEQQFKTLIESSNIQFPQIDQDTAHILFDSLLQMLKICKTLQYPILQNVYHYWTTYPHDSLLGQIFYEIIEILSTIDPQAIKQAFSQASGLIWLKVNTVVAKAQPNLLQGEVGQIAAQLINFNEFTPSGIMLLKTILQHNQLDNSTLQIVIQVLDIQLNAQKEPELEALTEHVQDLLLVIWNKHMNRQVSIQLLNKIAQKILHTETPSAINGLTTLLCAMYLQHDQQVLQWLQANQEATQKLINKWLRFASILSSQPLLQFQIQVIYSFTHLLYFDSLFYVDPFIDKVIPLKAKMLEFLIQHQSQNKPIQLAEDEFYDVEEQETEFEIDIANCNDLLKPITISYLHLNQYSKHLSKEQQQLFKKL